MSNTSNLLPLVSPRALILASPRLSGWLWSATCARLWGTMAKPHRLFTGGYVTPCPSIGALARRLAYNWLMPELRPCVMREVHNVQPRRRSVAVALRVYQKLLAIDPLGADLFIVAMQPPGRKKKVDSVD